MGLIDARYVSRFGSATFALAIQSASGPVDAEGDVLASLSTAPATGDPVVLWSGRVADHAQTGLYEVVVSSADTQTPGYYTLRFDYTLGGQPQTYIYDVEVGPSAPAYDALSPGWRAMVDSVWMRFADLFDSPDGGPNLQVYVQTHFGRNRVAQLANQALGDLNAASQPWRSYAMDQTFPFSRWGNLAEQGLYIEVLKHLIRSYVEQPEMVLSTSVSRADRRDYMNRWQTILDNEKDDYERNLSRFRQDAIMGSLGGASVLVSGGAFGNFGPIANAGGAGEAAARGYYVTRRWH